MNSHTKIFLIYYTECVATKNLGYEKINSVNPLYLYLNGYMKESHENKYLILVPTNESKDTPKVPEEIWNKFRDLIKSITNKSDKYDKKYINMIINVKIW